jgi:thioredoxin 1
MKSWRNLIIGLICLLSLTMAFGPLWPVAAHSSTPPPGKPALYEFGAGYCAACKEMAKILAELKPQYANQLHIRQVYADKDKDLFKKYKIMLIPTQVFLDASGHEVDRHIGALSKEALVAKLKELKFIH